MHGLDCTSGTASQMQPISDAENDLQQYATTSNVKTIQNKKLVKNAICHPLFHHQQGIKISNDKYQYGTISFMKKYCLHMNNDLMNNIIYKKHDSSRLLLTISFYLTSI